MDINQIVIVKPGHVELQKSTMVEKLEPFEVLVKTEHSIVSAGTEGSSFTGLIEEVEKYFNRPYPSKTGYGNLGEVISVGDSVTMCKPGDRVLSFASHASHVKADSSRMALPVPKDGDPLDLVFARMAGVSMSALRSSTVQPGDTVLVIGMGLVGNFAAQIFQLSGANVMVADISDLRLEKARECGISNTLNNHKHDLEEAVMDWTDGQGARIVVEAIGISELIAQAASITIKHGELILLGTPRAHAVFDATAMLLDIHMRAIKMIGALEWTWPQNPVQRARDITANYKLLVDWIYSGKLLTRPLLTHVAKPEECQDIYEGLTRNKDEYMSAVFDWT